MKMHRTMRTLLSVGNFLYSILLRIWSLLYCKKPSKLPPMKNPLFSLSATTLAKMIRQREITCYQVMHAYTNRVREVDCLLKAVADNRFRLAIVEAKMCDEQLATGKFDAETLKKEKPLYGVPITIKECFAVKGMSYTGCCLARKGIKATADSTIVELLRNAGAIPLCVTNTPEMCGSFETTNLLYGTTYNPYDIRFSAGGSSGGEGALLGAGASLIGVGSDVAGSIRIPSLFNGVFGHKPTPGLIPTKGHLPYSEDERFLRYLVLGPMARYAEDLHLLMTVLTSTCNRDLRLTVPVDLKQLKVYYLLGMEESLGLMPASQDIQQCVLNAANHFSELGVHTEKLSKNLWPATIVEVAMTSLLKIENPPSLLYSSDPKVQKNPKTEMVKALFGKSQHTKASIFFQYLIESHYPFSKSDLSYYTQHEEEIRRKLLDLLGENGVFLYPTFRCPTTFGKFLLLDFASCGYSSIFNIFGFPAVHVPMGLNHEGLPIGVQVIAAPYQDRLCLAVAKELETAFGGWTQPPFSDS